MTPLHKKSLIVLLILVVTALCGTLYGYWEHDRTLSVDTVLSENKSESISVVTVYVTGAVEKPGVVTLNEGSHLMDAVNACGGLLQTADSDKINLAQVLQDGQKVQIPEKNIANTNNTKQEKQNIKKQSKQKNNQPIENDGLININTASVEELDKLPGVGAATAQKIIEYRENEGGFQKPEDIKKVRGIGNAKYEKMKDKICT